MKPVKPPSKANLNAIILSALFPGAGQLYNGQKVKGFLFLIIWFVLEVVFDLLPESYWDILTGEVSVDFNLYIRLALLGGFRIGVVIDADRSAQDGSSK